jgi:hypothetical protein
MDLGRQNDVVDFFLPRRLSARAYPHNLDPVKRMGPVKNVVNSKLTFPDPLR